MPFTHISEKVASGIYELLGTTTIYHVGGLPIPLKLDQLAEKGLIRIRNPVKIAHDDLLFDLKHDFNTWASQRFNGSMIDTGVFMAALDLIPFYDENSSARIRTEINQLRRGESFTYSKDLILMVRLFLVLAQEHDAKKDDLDRDLSAVVHMEKDLLKNLKGDIEEELVSTQIRESVAEDVGAYMTQKRIDSWSLIYQADEKSADVFVTESQAVVEQLCETSQDLIRVPCMTGLMPQKGNLENHYNQPERMQNILTQLGYSDTPLILIEKWNSRTNRTNMIGQIQDNQGRWYLYFAPGISPDAFWRRYGERITTIKIDIKKKSDLLNTLIFYLEC
jgi:hypothetical protein